LDKSTSYSSSNIYPSKVLKAKELCVSNFGFIHPIHVQLCPTNICNLNCSFCSCSKREKTQQLSIEELKKTIIDFYKLGTKAVTITGGGEPCCYEELSELLKILSDLRISSGMVSNGLLLEKHKYYLNLLTWCRVSASDDRDIDKLINVLQKVIPTVHIDWAISYVVTAKFNIDKLAKIVQFANLNKLTHVRLVSDLLDLDNLVSMESIKIQLEEMGIDDGLVLYQDRSNYVRGNSECRISLLKPVIAPDGFVYPCCGVQYALPDSEGLFPKQMRMCSIKEIPTYFCQQNIFDGSICEKCYYPAYNDVLETLTEHYDHGVFV